MVHGESALFWEEQLGEVIHLNEKGASVLGNVPCKRERNICVISGNTPPGGLQTTNNKKHNVSQVIHLNKKGASEIFVLSVVILHQGDCKLLTRRRRNLIAHNKCMEVNVIIIKGSKS